MVHWCRMLGGVYSLGVTADHLGRRRGFLASALLLGAAGLASAIAPSFWVSNTWLCCPVINSVAAGVPVLPAPLCLQATDCCPSSKLAGCRLSAVAAGPPGHGGLCARWHTNCSHAVCRGLHVRK